MALKQQPPSTTLVPTAARQARHLRPVPLGLALLLGIGTLLVSCARHNQDTSKNTPASTDPQARLLAKGESIYVHQCARCHGDQGQGVAGKYDEALFGEKSIESLARLIAKTMPDDKPGTCTGDDAHAVATFIHGSFYSQNSKSRNTTIRRELSRLTNRQYRESIADLIGSFTPLRQATNTGGLHAEYFQSKGMNKKEKKALERKDREVSFDFGTNSPAESITADQFSIAWSGSIVARDSGLYQFRIVTPNGARLYLNTDLAAGDKNSRDDSDAKRQPALLDLWVSSGGMVREATAETYLLGGRTYPLRVDYFKFKEKTASIRFEWKPPHGVWSVIPSDVLSPESSSSTAVVNTVLPPDDASKGYERGTTISKAWHEATTKAAVEAAGIVESKLERMAGTKPGATNQTEILRTFARNFAERAFRRPLSPELQKEFIDQVFASSPTPEMAVKRVVILSLKSPRFLYPDLAEQQDDYAVASRLAIALWDSLPDTALLQAASKGELHTPDQIRTHARRMMADHRARSKIQNFFNHWLAIEEASDVTKDPKAFPDFNATILADLRTSLEYFVDDVVWSEKSDYRELLLSDSIYLNPRLAQFYQSPQPVTEGFQKVRFDASQRAGIFTHPFLLSAFSYHKSTSPIHRGVFLTRNVLGRFLKPPPMAIEFMDDRFDPTLTMREKVTQLTSKEACMGCHATINPLGFSLENYDAVGRYRTLDNNKPVNALADYITGDGKTITLRGPRDLANHAASSDEARRGFVRHLFQQTIKQAPAAYGEDLLAKLDSDFVKSGYRIRDLLVEIATISAVPATKTQLASQP